MTIQARHSTLPASIRMKITMPPATLAPMTTLSVFELLNPSVGGSVGSDNIPRETKIISVTLAVVKGQLPMFQHATLKHWE